MYSNSSGPIPNSVHNPSFSWKRLISINSLSRWYSPLPNWFCQKFKSTYHISKSETDPTDWWPWLALTNLTWTSNKSSLPFCRNKKQLIYLTLTTWTQSLPALDPIESIAKRLGFHRGLHWPHCALTSTALFFEIIPWKKGTNKKILTKRHLKNELLKTLLTRVLPRRQTNIFLPPTTWRADGIWK